MDWRDQLAADLTLFAKSFGVIGFDEVEVTRVFEELVIVDRGRKKDKREGYAYAADKYDEKQFASFLRRVGKQWDMVILPEIPKAQTQFPHMCALSLKLDKDTYNAADLKPILDTYLKSALGEVFQVTQMTRVFGSWYDMMIEYSCNLSQLYELVNAPDWVKQVVTKPRSEYGRRNVQMFR